jgi:hypothetical protein
MTGRRGVTVDFAYFEAQRFATARQLVHGREFEVPVRPILDSATKQGGFDVFVYLPIGCPGENWGDTPKTEHIEPSGQTGGGSRRKYTYRLREWAANQGVSPLAMNTMKVTAHDDSAGFRMGGDILFDDGPVLPEVQKLQFAQKRSGLVAWIGMAVAGLALLVAVLGIILTILQSNPSA